MANNGNKRITANKYEYEYEWMAYDIVSGEKKSAMVD